MKPIESSIVLPIDRFFEIDSTQCLCYRLPSKQDGWVIQGLGQLEQQETINEMYQLIGNDPPLVISEPSFGVPFFCAVGIVALAIKK